MAYLQIHSENPDISFILRKNPNSSMALRKMRRGIAHAWFSDAQTYNIYFRDADNEVSYHAYESDEFEYLNISRYNSPNFVLNSLNEFLTYATKGEDDRDAEGFTHKFTVGALNIPTQRYIQFFRNHIPDVSIDVHEFGKGTFNIVFSTQKKVAFLLRVVAIFCLFAAIHGDESVDISDSLIVKYLDYLIDIDAPFYLRYLFTRNVLDKVGKFAKYRDRIQKTERYAIELQGGGTGNQRRAFIKKQLDFTRPIVDIGCGEGAYAVNFAPVLDHDYHAIDTDIDVLENLRGKVSARKIDNISFHDSFDDFLAQYNGDEVDVILTEVIEHMPLEESFVFVDRILAQVNFNKFIITTPNADFNEHYMTEGFRHDDHRWEAGFTEFKRLLDKLLIRYNFNVEYIGVGDAVDSQHTTSSAIITKGGN